MSVRIANKALRRIHAAPISNLDGTDERKRTVQEELDCAVDYILRKHNWADLTHIYCPDEAQVCDPCCELPEGFCFAFNMPADYLKTVRVDVKNCDPKCPPPCVQWRVIKHDGCDVLVTDCKPIRMEYICRPDNLDALPPDLQRAIYLHLAMELVPVMQADKSLRAEIMQEYEMALRDAMVASDEHDQTDHYLNDPGELVEARLCSWWPHGGGRHYG